MANEQNLRPFNKMSVKEQRAISRKGVEARKQRKLEEINFAKTMSAIIQNNDTTKLNEILNQLGIKDPKKVDFLTKWVGFWQFKLMDKHCRARDVKDFLEFARDTIGQNPTQKNEITTNQPIQIIIKNEDTNC